MNSFYKLATATALFASIMGAAPAMAQTVVGANTITSPSGSFLFNPLISIINQSGLSTGYASGVSSYDNFIATTNSSPIGSINAGFTASVGVPQTFTFGFSSSVSLDGIAFFSVNNTGSVTQFGLYADNDSDFTNGTSSFLGTFNAQANIYTAQSFSFSAVTTNFIQLRALNVAGDIALNLPGIGEVAFRSASGAVPEPATWAMMIGGFGAIGGAMRNRRGKFSINFA